MRPEAPQDLSLDDLVDRYLPEYREGTPLIDRLGLHLVTFVLLGWGSMFVPALLPVSVADAVGRLALVGLVPASVGLTEVILWRRRARASGAIERDLRSGRLLERLARRFRQEVDRHRERMLGPNAHWSITRKTLVRAKDEADRQVAYWTERGLADQSAEIHRHRQLAQDLRGKYELAIRDLDERGDSILAFINRCEAKLGALETAHQDQAKSARLHELSVEAEATISHAHGHLRSVADSFMNEALRLGSALRSLDEVRLLKQASLARIDEIEPIAEQIAESARADSVKLRELQRSLG